MIAVLWIVAGPDTLQAEVDVLKRLQVETAAGKTLKSAIFPPSLHSGATGPSSRGFRLRIASPRQADETGDRAFEGES